jgi:tetratricopeptide (TPR) repeat protein
LRTGDDAVLKKTEENCQRFPAQKQEFLYLSCWAARRLRRYAEAIRYTDDGVALYPEDGRFYNGRSLSKFCWIQGRDGSERCPWTLASAIEDSQEALRLFRDDSKKYQDLIAATVNNIAFFYLCAKDEIPMWLEEASKYFSELVRILPRSKWRPEIPEYFHTEAVLHYERYFDDRRKGVSESGARRHLVAAMQSLREAMKLESSPEYLELEGQIQRRLKSPGRTSR